MTKIATRKPSGDTAEKKRQRRAERAEAARAMMDDQTLQYPTDIAPKIGISTTALGILKMQGCPFVGRKTSVAWVRAFLAQQSGAAALFTQSR